MPQRQKNFEGELCEECGVEPKGKVGGKLLEDGTTQYMSTCYTCKRTRYTRPWLRFRKNACEACGHRPMFKRVLTVHHRDGDNTNNEPTNLTTLCTNCHGDLEGFIYELDGNFEKAEGMLKRFVKTLFR